MGRLSGKVAIVTGAAQGIGAAFAKALAAEGAELSICDLQAPSSVVKDIEATGNKAIGFACDVTDPAAVAKLAAETERAFGGILYPRQ